MSSSFLKPVVTPVTALATSARASPWTARCSSVSRSALSTPSFCSSLLRRGTPTVLLPFGPCTSILSAAMPIFTPVGTVIGLRPIRDIFLPNLAENFAADAGFASGAAAHQAFRRGQNADAQAADDGANFGRAGVTASAGARNALHASDHAAAIGRVLQENPEHLARLVLVDKLQAPHIALFLQDACNLGL